MNQANKSKVRYWSVILILLAVSCNSNDCEVNIPLKIDFTNAMQTIYNSEVKRQDGYVSDKLEAIMFLSELTKHESQIESLEFPIYYDKSLYREDVKAWNAWYRENKCIGLDKYYGKESLLEGW